MRILHGLIAIWSRQNIVAAGPANGLKNRVIRCVYSFGISAQSGSIDWRGQAEPYRRAIAQYLSDSFLPNLGNEIATSLLLTPQYFQDRLRYATLGELCAGYLYR